MTKGDVACQDGSSDCRAQWFARVSGLHELRLEEMTTAIKTGHEQAGCLHVHAMPCNLPCRAMPCMQNIDTHTLHYIAFQYVTLHCITLHTYVDTLCCVTLRYNVCLDIHALTQIHWRTYVTVRHGTVQHAKVRYGTLHYITLDYMSLPFISIHFIITLHYNTFIAYTASDYNCKSCVMRYHTTQYILTCIDIAH